jgi:hypothetical protein
VEVAGQVRAPVAVSYQSDFYHDGTFR